MCIDIRPTNFQQGLLSKASATRDEFTRLRFLVIYYYLNP